MAIRPQCTLHESSSVNQREGLLHQSCLPTLLRSLLAPQDVPVADAKAEDIQELLGGALFKALYKWMVESGPVYLLPTGGKS